MTLYLTKNEVRSILDVKSTVEAIESGFREMGLGHRNHLYAFPNAVAYG